MLELINVESNLVDIKKKIIICEFKDTDATKQQYEYIKDKLKDYKPLMDIDCQIDSLEVYFNSGILSVGMIINFYDPLMKNKEELNEIDKKL